ncbi:MAG: P-type conjugative transfer protein TrbG [Pseudomonadota bacterium]
MTKTHLITILLGAVSLTACESLDLGTKAPDIVLDDEPFIEAMYLAEDDAAPVTDAVSPAAPIVARTFGPSVSPSQIAGAGPSEPLAPHKAIDQANASAAIEPSSANYMNAIQIYPYTRGALYQVYAAPEQVTDIALQAGEELMSVSAGDTVRWVLGDTVSGAGDQAQVHILVKPIQPGLKTNLIITTSRRAYHLELHAFRETYMAAVSWRYSDQPLVRRMAESSGDNERGPQGLQLDRLRFRYEISGDEPHWRPTRVFDDGRKVYIQFPARLDQGEAPPLFVVGRDGKSQLVNYRMRDNYYVVDRLFALAELRLGEKNQDVVRIERNDLQMASR